MDQEKIAERVASQRVSADARLERLIPRWKAMTQRNAHTDALVELAEYVGNRRVMEVIKAISVIHDYEGHLNACNSKLSYDLYKFLMSTMQSRLSPEDYERLNRAF